MGAPCYIAWNAATSALTAPMVGSNIAGTTKKTALLLTPTKKIRVVEWGYSFDTVPGTPMQVELIETDVAATMNATAATVAPYNDVGASTSAVTAGFTATAEGTITATRLLAQGHDLSMLKQPFPLGREPEVSAGKFLRVRASGTAAGTVTIYTYVIWEE